MTVGPNIQYIANPSSPGSAEIAGDAVVGIRFQMIF